MNSVLVFIVTSYRKTWQNIKCTQYVIDGIVRSYLVVLKHTHTQSNTESHLALRVLQQPVLGVHLLLDGVVDVKQHGVTVLVALTQGLNQLLLPLVSQRPPLSPPLPQLLVPYLLAPDKLLLQLMKPENQNSLFSSCSHFPCICVCHDPPPPPPHHHHRRHLSSHRQCNKAVLAKNITSFK